MVSLHEIAIKIRIGKLTVDIGELIAKLDEFDFERLYVEDRHCVTMAGIAWVPKHGDPFNIMLVAQALADNLLIVTNDGQMAKYPVSVMGCGGARG